MKEEWSVGIEFPVDCGLEGGEAQLEDGETPRARALSFVGANTPSRPINSNSDFRPLIAKL